MADDTTIKQWGIPVRMKCVNAHDRCYDGSGGPCDYCEPVYLHELAAEARRRKKEKQERETRRVSNE